MTTPAPYFIMPIQQYSNKMDLQYISEIIWKLGTLKFDSWSSCSPFFMVTLGVYHSISMYIVYRVSDQPTNPNIIAIEVTGSVSQWLEHFLRWISAAWRVVLLFLRSDDWFCSFTLGRRWEDLAMLAQPLKTVDFTNWLCPQLSQPGNGKSTIGVSEFPGELSPKGEFPWPYQPDSTGFTNGTGGCCCKLQPDSSHHAERQQENRQRQHLTQAVEKIACDRLHAPRIQNHPRNTWIRGVHQSSDDIYLVALVSYDWRPSCVKIHILIINNYNNINRYCRH